MIEFKRILFPVDFSAQSRAVAPSVKAMARHFGSEVTVLHVGGDAHAELDRFVEQELAGVPAIRELAEGDAAQQIVDYAHGHRTDLIMIPTHGHGPFRALLLGSVTVQVLDDSDCPVWTSVHATVHPEVHAEDAPPHSPERWKSMLCAVDTDGEDVALVQWASAFAAEQKMELRLVHAVAGADGMWTEERDPSMYEFLFDAARERLADLQAKAGTNLEVRLIAGAVGSAVHKAALERDANLLVMGRGAYSIIREAPCPVISV
jgi:nucleotide-binding universal stress UspA family protein